ncbi:MAG TPA: sensor domain-containing protein [Streptosporangiaceae bacterium]
MGAVPLEPDSLAAASQPAAHRPGAAWPGTLASPGGAEPEVMLPRDRAGRRRVLLQALRGPFSRVARRQRAYAALNPLLAIAGCAFAVVTVVAGLGLSLTGAGLVIGLPLLIGSALGARWLGGVSRGLARRVIGVHVAAPPPLRPLPGRLGWIRAVLTDPAGWRARAYLLLKLPVALLGLAALAAPWGLGLLYLGYPLFWSVFHELARHGIVINIGLPAAPDVLPYTFLMIPLGALMVRAGPRLTWAVNSLDVALITRLLGPVSLPQRVRELERTRAAAVDDSAARLRSIERDLHDGAQAQMVAVAMKLGLAREKLGGTAGAAAPDDFERALELVDAAHHSAKQAIIELRALARRIHPPVLDGGLGTALQTLAARSGVPVEVIIDLPRRPAAAIETIAYFCAAELLANVAKHSGARQATLEAVHVPGLVRLRVSDDGRGGARIAGGSGLAGLAERIRTVDGHLGISSPRGGPTVVTIELPAQL